MARILRFLVTLFAVVGLVAINGFALAQPKDKDRKEQSDIKGKKDGKEQKVKGHKHHDGKTLVGDKIMKEGKHEFHKNGKHTAFVNAKGGKITGVTVTHSEKGNVPVKKYKTTKKMAEDSAGSMQRVSFVLTQAQDLGTIFFLLGEPASHRKAYDRAKALLARAPVNHEIIEEHDAERFSRRLRALREHTTD